MGHFMTGGRLASLFMFLFISAFRHAIGLAGVFSLLCFWFMISLFPFFYVSSFFFLYTFFWKSHEGFKGDRKNNIFQVAMNGRIYTTHTTRNATHTHTRKHAIP